MTLRDFGAVDTLSHLAAHQMRDLQVYAEQALVRDSVKLFIGGRNPSGRSVIVLPTTLTMKVEDESISAMMEPSLELPRSLLQTMMASCWRLGIKPAGINDDSERVAILKEHIADLREQLKRAQEVQKGLMDIIGAQTLSEPLPVTTR